MKTLDIMLNFKFNCMPEKSGSYLVLVKNKITYHLSTVDYSAKWKRWNANDALPPMYAFKDSDVVAWADITDAERMVNYEYTKQFVSKDTADNQ